jgi:hypothetical protein
MFEKLAASQQHLIQTKSFKMKYAPFHRLLRSSTVALVLAMTASASAQPLKRNPTPADYVERNGGGASIVPAGKLILDGHRMKCGQWATILDHNLNDYASSYPQFVILGPPYVAKVATPVKLWIYSHECGHSRLFRDPARPGGWLAYAAGARSGVCLHQCSAPRCCAR